MPKSSPADAAGSHGTRLDVLILKELSHIGKLEFAETLAGQLEQSSSTGSLWIATNAGFTGSPAYKWRELARTSDRWHFEQFSQPSPWLDAAEIEEARIRNSQERFARLWLGIWSSGSGDALDEADILAAVTQTGPLSVRDPYILNGWSFIAGLDVGIKHDHSALVILGTQHGSGRIRVASVQSWKPSRGGQVDLTAVESAIMEAHRSYRLLKMLYDPHQAQHMAQRVRRICGLTCEEMNFVGANLDRMATVLMEVFRSRTIDMYEHPQLIRDLQRLVIEEKPYGQRLTAVSDADGHADTATALAIALPAAQRLAHYGSFNASPPTSGYLVRDPSRHGVGLKRPGVVSTFSDSRVRMKAKTRHNW